MGILFSNRLPRICSTYEDVCARVLLLGLDAAGKSTLLARFKNLVDRQNDVETEFIETIRTEPTFVYQVETIYPRLTPLALNIWDLGGQEKTRDLWRFYLTGVQGIVFVIDSDDKDRLLVAREELLNLAEILDSGSNIPIIIAANKQDLRDALSKDEIIDVLQLSKVDIGEWKCFEISAHTGSGVMEMFSYLSEFIHRHRNR